MKMSLDLSGVAELQWYRCLSKSAWMLHGYLMGCLVVMPFCQSVRAVEEGDFVQTGAESYVEVTLSCSEGTSHFEAGTSRTVTATVMTHSWEVWTHTVTGESQIRQESWVPFVGAALDCFVSQSTGWMNVGMGNAGTDGTASFTIQGSSEPISVKVSTSSGAEGILSFDAPVEPETWSFTRYEGLISAVVNDLGDTNHLPSGTVKEVEVTVSYTSWEVQTSNFGNTRAENSSTSLQKERR